MKIARETVIISLIGIADLITTIIFIENHGAQEANPLFRRYWEMGIPTFVVAKLVMLICPLMILEWARRRNPRFVSFALRSGIAAYIALYGLGFFKLNGPEARANEVAVAAPEPMGPGWLPPPSEDYIQRRLSEVRRREGRPIGIGMFHDPGNPRKFWEAQRSLYLNRREAREKMAKRTVPMPLPDEM